MPKVELYGYFRCSSCRDAEALLHRLGVYFTKRDLFAEQMTADEVKELFDRSGLIASDVLSTRSRPFRELELSERELSDSEIVSLMADHPALIRRPITVRGNKAVVGFK